MKLGGGYSAWCCYFSFLVMVKVARLVLNTKVSRTDVYLAVLFVLRTPMWNRGNAYLYCRTQQLIQWCLTIAVLTATAHGKMYSTFGMHFHIKGLERSTYNTHALCIMEGGG